MEVVLRIKCGSEAVVALTEGLCLASPWINYW